MPELPEVETMRRGIKAVTGATIVSAIRTPCKKKPIEISPPVNQLQKRIVGRKIVAVERLGKRVVVRLDTVDRLIFEPRMTGLVLIEDPPGGEHLRFQMRLKGATVDELLFWDRRGLGRIELLSDEEYQAKLTSGKLGPDALDISEAEFPSRFNSSGRAIKVAMLDQSTVAGIGNIYAAEILHLARVHPALPCNRVKDSVWPDIFRHMRDVLITAIKYEGSTLSDGTYRNALNEKGGYQNEHRVYDREGEACRQCKRGIIKRIVQAQRSTFFCPSCQPMIALRKKK
ncbi:MAG: bifunctional DNA-formamidopyrimidine glycosylase/DNA-(apurinic or apyrimidinic site) lyase [Planctomycetota bacterium]